MDLSQYGSRNLHVYLSGYSHVVTMPVPEKYTDFNWGFYDFEPKAGAWETYYDVETKKHKTVYSVCDLASPYVVGWDFCWNYKYFLDFDYNTRKVTFRCFNTCYNDRTILFKLWVFCFKLRDFKRLKRTYNYKWYNLWRILIV